MWNVVVATYFSTKCLKLVENFILPSDSKDFKVFPVYFMQKSLNSLSFDWNFIGDWEISCHKGKKRLSLGSFLDASL